MLITPEQAPESPKDHNNMGKLNEAVDSHQKENKGHVSQSTHHRTPMNSPNCRPTSVKDYVVEKPCIAGLSCLRIDDIKTPNNFLPQSRCQKTISIPGQTTNLPLKKSPRFVKKALFLTDDNDNDAFRASSPLHIKTQTSHIESPTSNNFPSLSNPHDTEKQQEIMSGRLYLLRQIGNSSHCSGSPSSPSRTFAKPFSFAPVGVASPSSSPPSNQTQNTKRKLPVYLRIYRCNKDHFALMSRDSSYSSGHIYLNLKHSRVIPGEPIGRFVVAGNSDSGSLMEFETPELNCLESWLDALHSQTPPDSPIRGGQGQCAGSSDQSGSSSTRSPSLPKSPGLPTLTETEEDSYA